MTTMPNRLRLIDGELTMIDGTDTRQYLQSFQELEGKDVVVLDRKHAQQLLQDATKWRSTYDEQFALCS